MVQPYQGHYEYSDNVVKNWNSTATGVYYCGYRTAENNLAILYVGKAVGADGIRGRLLCHMREDHWPDVTHFGYHLANSELEATQWEAEEIARYKPKYNKIGK